MKNSYEFSTIAYLTPELCSQFDAEMFVDLFRPNLFHSTLIGDWKNFGITIPEKMLKPGWTYNPDFYSVGT